MTIVDIKSADSLAKEYIEEKKNDVKRRLESSYMRAFKSEEKNSMWEKIYPTTGSNHHNCIPALHHCNKIPRVGDILIDRQHRQRGSMDAWFHSWQLYKSITNTSYNYKYMHCARYSENVVTKYRVVCVV